MVQMVQMSERAKHSTVKAQKLLTVQGLKVTSAVSTLAVSVSHEARWQFIHLEIKLVFTAYGNINFSKDCTEPIKTPSGLNTQLFKFNVGGSYEGKVKGKSNPITDIL